MIVWLFHSREMRKDHVLAKELEKVKLGSLLPSSLSKDLEKKYLDSEEVRICSTPELPREAITCPVYVLLPCELHILPERSKSKNAFI